MRLLLLFITASVILISSCTIQKRAFRKGYYISWNKSLPKEKPVSQDKAAETNREEIAESGVSKDSVRCVEELPEDLTVVEEPDTLLIHEPLVSKKDSSEKKRPERYSEETLMKHLSEAVESMKESKDYQIEEESTGKKLNLFSLNSLVFSITYVILLFAALNVNNVTLAITGIVICAIVALIFAIIGLVKWGRDRTRFWGTFFSVIALGLLVMGFLAFLLFVIASLSFS